MQVGQSPATQLCHPPGRMLESAGKTAPCDMESSFHLTAYGWEQADEESGRLYYGLVVC